MTASGNACRYQVMRIPIQQGWVDHCLHRALYCAPVVGCSHRIVYLLTGCERYSGDLEPRAAPALGQPDRPIVGVDDFCDDCQSEPGAALRGRIAGSEDIGSNGCRDARAIVLDIDPLRPDESSTNRNTGSTMFNAIAEDVLKDVFDSVSISRLC
ncbi:hypothetical protein SAMN05444271_1705 [Halohasta litchfieldiae]|uniref:Uncharacterized protein n=1 Tax=Halohasta litchfieldiae TaxID=1073996 RepID=A0A1H6YQN3_9EURY|nr:hypothetical protein SAMN05444271_1705 [Halohasta litchfieldiae]